MTETSQFSLFKDCLASQLLSKPDFSNAADDSELDEFASYLAEEAWPILPQSYQEATYEARDSILPSIDSISLDNVSPSFVDTFISYGLAPNADHDDAVKFLYKVIGEYVEQACAPPPVWKATRATECEICEREVALSYHHLIPRSTHAKVLRRGWHPESMLNKVAWLCRACHSAVHRVATNEELAQHYHTVELLLVREDIQRWRAYAAKQKWRPRPKRH
ncbi:hypothetical protein CC1G_02648 [Coprinopsis cinerea okayama7|uniref:HNH domain-containing protein n=1 Tax=Coprinopsis cinerea (strain Okayama-7 / 130 / ATCC MYA-4618 / FGSC 9003) TaxID=240176 RepID=A8PBH6_COPC7|nr:hypothetical protein CC1G_02648 [Coprinopsis cinerea okayama7\|eukprot:XP_001840185.1 hypothetical protein CC1G_02648 [Coprinopsis cinerea okayama7\